MTGDLSGLLPCKGLSPEPTISVESPASTEGETYGMSLAVPSDNVSLVIFDISSTQFPKPFDPYAVIYFVVGHPKTLPTYSHSSWTSYYMGRTLD